ncbi:MAG: ABC transporter substrate-binding protein [Oscillospiraceae bacterium]|nr:ABC transporter substrate-binding protein [Oscillospiraceae bacterium]MDD7293740.1 ABC transporter substrate-binding protein [Clostridiaceae bacterium]MDY5991226.1 ABC transporter substrate-binding protein [Oscillospiraceae bacterium]
MKKLLAILLSALLVFSLVACSGGSNETTAPSDSGESQSSGSTGNDVVKIGVFEPQSGANGAGGKQEILGMQYANYVQPTVEIGGKTYDVKLEIVDNESSTDKAPTAAQTLVSAGVSVVLGSYGSSVAIAGSPVFKNGGIPAIGVTCTNPQVTEGNDHYFRICFLDPFQGTVLANYAFKELGAKKAYILAELGNDYDQGLANYFTKAFEKLGGSVVRGDFTKGTSDFTSYLANAKNDKCEVIFSPTSIQYAQLIVEQSTSQGTGLPLLASDTWDSNVILNAAKGTDAKIYVTTFYQEGGNKEFDEGIKKWINEDSTAKTNNGGDDTVAAVTAMGYDAYFVALEALKKAGSTAPADVMKVLPSVTFDGVSGKIEFNETGDAKRDTAFVKNANTETGAWDFVAKQGV